MKALSLFLLFGCLLSVKAQVIQATVNESNTSDDVAVPLMVIEEVPVYPGCEDVEKNERRNCLQEKIKEHIKNTLQYPKDAEKEGIQGRVLTSFVIDINGNISDLYLRGPHPSLEKEARRIIESLPKMQPGKIKDKLTAMRFSVPIMFRLE
jgi:TonB family protein